MTTIALRGERPPTPPTTIDPRPRAALAHDSPASHEAPRSFARVLAGLGDESVRGEAQVSHALHATAKGRDLSGAELLALQAGVYRYGEVVDLASRLVDRAATAVKTVIQGQ